MQECIMACVAICVNGFGSSSYDCSIWPWRLLCVHVLKDGSYVILKAESLKNPVKLSNYKI